MRAIGCAVTIEITGFFWKSCIATVTKSTKPCNRNGYRVFSFPVSGVAGAAGSDAHAVASNTKSAMTATRTKIAKTPCNYK